MARHTIALLMSAAGLLAASPTYAQTQAQAPAAATTAPAPPVDPFAGIPAANPADVQSIDGIMKAIYDVISGDAGVERDWNRFLSLFYPGTRFMAAGISAKTKEVVVRTMTLDEYIKNSGPLMEKKGFNEIELARRVEQYGKITQVFSSYATRYKANDPEPFSRGINSVQLLNDGKRWWVVSLIWNSETPENPLPPEFTGKP